MSVPELNERFDTGTLDTDVWFPYYLPHWSSRAKSAARYELVEEGLLLVIPEDQPLWCPDRHEEPLRVSCIQSGEFAGPVGSTVGQQRIHDGDTVREEQPTMWGYTPLYGHIEVTMRGSISPRSMFAFWMSGIEDRSERSGEICVAEIFGDAIEGEHADVGMGLHAFRDPRLVEEFSTIPLDIEVARSHTYGVEWRPDSITFTVDGETVRKSDQSPDYPMQLMIGLFDYPGKAEENEPAHVPKMWVSRVSGRPLGIR